MQLFNIFYDDWWGYHSAKYLLSTWTHRGVSESAIVQFDKILLGPSLEQTRSKQNKKVRPD